MRRRCPRPPPLLSPSPVVPAPVRTTACQQVTVSSSFPFSSLDLLFSITGKKHLFYTVKVISHCLPKFKVNLGLANSGLQLVHPEEPHKTGSTHFHKSQGVLLTTAFSPASLGVSLCPGPTCPQWQQGKQLQVFSGP